jgi:WhiB family redox-sensing transcriptional regulator
MPNSGLSFFISGEQVRWMDRAYCNGISFQDSEDLFFADEWTRRRGLPAEVPPDTQRVCGACDVRIECLEWALTNDEEGVWGGTTRQQREAMKRPIVRAKCPACQSVNLFRAGIRQVCGDCASSWEATKIHGDARSPVEQPPADTPLPLHPGHVIRLPATWTYEQQSLFAATVVEGAKRRRSRVPRHKARTETQQPIPGVASPAGQAETVVLAVAAA